MNQNQDALKYLQRDDIGKVIAKGLASVFNSKPQRPIKYLAQWLKSYSNNKKQLQKISESQTKKSQYLSLFYETQKLNQLHKAEVQKKALQTTSTLQSFKNTLTSHEYHQQLLLESFPQFIEQNAKITGCYIGQLNHPPRQITDQDTDQLAHLNTGEPKGINYVGSSKSHKFMRGKRIGIAVGVTGKVFKQGKEGEQGDNAGKEGEQAEGKEGEEGKQGDKASKKYVYVPNVVKNQSMHYFRIPKLGAYLAVPLVCQSYLVERIFDQALAEKKKQISEHELFQKKKTQQIEQLNKNKDQLSKKIHQMRQKHVDEAQIQPINNQLTQLNNKIAQKQSQSYKKQQIQLNLAKNSYVVCVDNLGKDQQLDQKDIDLITDLVSHLKTSWQQKQKQLLFKDIETQISYLQSLPSPPQTISQSLSKLSILDPQQQKSKQLALLQSQPLRLYKIQQQQLSRLRHQLKSNPLYLNSFLKLREFRVVKFRDFLQNLLFFIGRKKGQVNVNGRASLDWRAVKDTGVTQGVFNEIVGYVVQGAKEGEVMPYSKTPFLLTIFEKFNQDEIFAYNIGLGALLKFVKKALKHRLSNVQLRKAQRQVQRRQRQALIQQNQKIDLQKAQQLKQYKNNLPPEEVESFKQEEWMEKYEKEHPKNEVPGEIVDDIDNDM